MAFSVHLTGASQQALDALSKTLAARMKYLNETVSASAHAILTQTLRSVRAATKVAKPGRAKVTVKQRGDLRFSYSMRGGFRKMCLRDAGGTRLDGNALGKPRFAPEVRGLKLKDVRVFEFADADKQTYLIAAPSKASAQKVAKTIASRRVMRYAGLARRALSVLMIKSNTKGAFETVAEHVNRKAYAETRTSETVVKTATGGVYTLTALDNLRYAKLAVNGDPVASDPHTAHIQLSVTVIQTGDAAPTVTPADGWDLSAPLTCSDPDADLPTWTCSVSKPIAKTLA